MITGLIAALVFLLLLFWVVGAYQRLCKLRAQLLAAFIPLESQLNQRHRLIRELLKLASPFLQPHEPRLVERLILACDHVEKVMKAVHAKPISVNRLRALGKAEQMLNLVLEAFQLAADLHVQDIERVSLIALTQRFQEAEVRGEFARQIYNDAALTLNRAVQEMPTRLLSSLMGFSAVSRLSRYAAPGTRREGQPTAATAPPAHE
jgi:LemA protein